MNEKKLLLSRIYAFAALLLVVFLFQTCFAQSFTLLETVPSALIASAVVAGMFGGFKAGLWFGLALGLMCDATVGSLFGYYSLTLMYTGLLSGALVELMIWRKFISAVLLHFLSYAFMLLSTLCIQLLIVGRTDTVLHYVFHYIKESVYSVILLIPLYFCGRHIYQKYYSED